MQFKGKYKQTYTLDNEQKVLYVEVELKKNDSLLKPRQNVYYGVAIVNDEDFEHKDLANCINAQFMAEAIGLELISEMKIKYNKEGKSFRLKRKK